ncbi:MAG: YjgN family protein [Pseudomonadota bacterium]
MDQAAAEGQTLEGQTRLPVRFAGSGSEYFRIWIVNLLLTIVTLGLYHPWAKVRKLRYFYGNTLVGEHALDFHGDPKRMLRGFLLVGALLVAYSVAGQVSPTAGLIALVVVAAVWPALFRAAMQFRLANTSWRGMRFHFNGELAGAYKALLPLFIPGMLFLGFLQGLPDDPKAAPPDWLTAGLLISQLAVFAVLPLGWWAIKRYQHNHYLFGTVQTQLRAGPGSFYGVFFKTLGVVLLLAFACGAAVAVAAAGAGVSLFARQPSAEGMKFAFAAIGIVAVVGYIGFIVLVQSFFASRMQNLLWNRTKSTRVRFESRLRVRPMLWLTLKNWLLTLLTLGFYWPFAAIATARLKLESVTVFTRTDPDQIVERARLVNADASGEAAADLFGIDVGL